MSKRRRDPRAATRRDRIKDAQLCAQVREAVSLALASIEDEVLLDLWVIEVVPAPDSSRLAVRLGASPSVDALEVRARLERHAGLIRGEVTSAIHRKKTPHLSYELLAHGDD